jgi:p-cumate 2,3-dioxygenase beta subunit
VELTFEAAQAFLFDEAELLDSWSLNEWLGLFTPTCEYLVPTNDLPDGDPARDLFLIYDDRFQLEQRVARLLKRTAYAEYPRSLTRRLVSNVRILDQRDGRAKLACNFITYRSAPGRCDVFPGHARYDLVAGPAQTPLIERKLAVIDTVSLSDQGRLSIIL